MNRWFLYGLFFLFLLSCRNDGAEAQKIDQVIDVYMKNQSGTDLLNKKLPGSFQSVQLYDLGGIRDQISLGEATLKKDEDTLNYIHYIAGAKRNLVDSSNSSLKIYRSDILLKLRKAAADSADLDTMTVFYEWTPEIFRVKSINYNARKVFQKTGDERNSFTVVK